MSVSGLQLSANGHGDAVVAIGALAQDAIAGLGVYVVPGPDRYSQVQGVVDSSPGAFEADVVAFFVETAEGFMPLPDGGARALAHALTTATADATGVDPPAGPLHEAARRIDHLLGRMVANHETVPLALLVALYLNFVATLVRPAAVIGPFASPFANLTFNEKSEAIRRMEREWPAHAAMLDSGLPEPVRKTLSGTLALIPGAALALAGFGAYSEFGRFDPTAPMTLTGQPVGWELSGYQDGLLRSPDGWADHRGYLGGRRRAGPPVRGVNDA